MCAQQLLFAEPAAVTADETSSTFVNNMTLPVHRWFRYSAGFSAEWAASVIDSQSSKSAVRLFDPFAGSGTSLIVAETSGVESFGIDSHPFVVRIAQAKLHWRSDPEAYKNKIRNIRTCAAEVRPDLEGYARLIRNCYTDDALKQLDQLRRAYEIHRDDSPASELAWLSLVGILRRTSKAGTAQWQCVLPKKQKRAAVPPMDAFDSFCQMVLQDMRTGQTLTGPRARLLQSDARLCAGVPEGYANLVITSPPYPNNYDYADATRLEMSFLREIAGWGCLQDKVRKHLIRSCSQHVPERAIGLKQVLASPELAPIADEITSICEQLAGIRLSRGGRKTYHLMVGCYFLDLALVWRSLRRVCDSPSKACLVIGDSAPYGVYVPVIPWLGQLALAAGFRSYRFEKTRDRNVKWRNRKHQVPLQEGRLWVEG